MSNFFRLQKLEIYKIIDELLAQGATSVPLLAENCKLKLLQEAQNYSYLPEPELVGKAS